VESPRPTTVVTDDTYRLEAEVAVAEAERCGMVLCHPHPQYGGTMRSIVISALFGALPAAGVTCLRFNFRGVGGSEGSHGEGRDERRDVEAAVRDLAAVLAPTSPLILTGWSFGADVALSVDDDRIDAWFAIAPPLRYAAAVDAVAGDARPKLVALAEHDEFRSPAEIQEVTASWAATEVVVVPGASHFFVGRTDRLVDVALGLVDRLAREAEPVRFRSRGAG
jgi:alpha/beta superfamily hydrolase